MPSRVIIFSGKGGTGKTTISAATAALLAREGKKVLIISTDPAHSLSDVICQPIGLDRPTYLAPNLYGLEVDAPTEARRSMSGLQNYMENAYKKQGVTGSVAAELAGQPGLDEIISLNRLMEESESGKWDVVLVDTAPTGNTLRLLAYPELIVGGTSGASLVKAYKGISKVMRPLSKDEGTKEKYFNEVNRLIEIMRKLNRFILSPEVSVRLVLNAEKLSVEETKRAYTFLSLYGIALDAVMVNKLYPRQASDSAWIMGVDGQKTESFELGPYFNKWVDLQYHHLTDIENSFSPLPILKAFLQRTEPLGVEKLADLGELVYGLLKPADRYNQKRVVWVEDIKNKNKNEAIRRNLCLRLPFVEDSDHEVVVQRKGEELVIDFGRLQRRISLPRILNDAEFVGLIYQDGVLKLGFSEAVNVKPLKPIATATRPVATFDDPFSIN